MYQLIILLAIGHRRFFYLLYLVLASGILLVQSCANNPANDQQINDSNLSEELLSELPPARRVNDTEILLPLECEVDYNSTTALNQFVLNEDISQAHKNILIGSLTTSLNFMYCFLGEPIVKQKILVEIDGKRPDLIAVTQWQLGSSERKIVINPKELEARTVFDRTLVHELVHALYQNDRFFINNRDFIIEGMASYFENYYRFGLNKEQVVDHLQDRIKAIVEAIGMCLDAREGVVASDVNKDFDEFDRNQVDVMYNLSAYYWFIVEEVKGVDASKEILRILSTYRGEPTEHIENKKAFILKRFEEWYGIDLDFSKHLPVAQKQADPICT